MEARGINEMYVVYCHYAVFVKLIMQMTGDEEDILMLLQDGHYFV
jgi:hypothetical protein